MKINSIFISIYPLAVCQRLWFRLVCALCDILIAVTELQKYYSLAYHSTFIDAIFSAKDKNLATMNRLVPEDTPALQQIIRPMFDVETEAGGPGTIAWCRFSWTFYLMQNDLNFSRNRRIVTLHTSVILDRMCNMFVCLFDSPCLLRVEITIYCRSLLISQMINIRCFHKIPVVVNSSLYYDVLNFIK